MYLTFGYSGHWQSWMDLHLQSSNFESYLDLQLEQEVHLFSFVVPLDFVVVAAVVVVEHLEYWELRLNQPGSFLNSRIETKLLVEGGEAAGVVVELELGVEEHFGN